MASKRRYKIDDNTKVYHDKFDSLRISSPILNAGSNNISILDRILDWSLTELKSQLLQRVGDDQGYFYKETSQYMATLPFAKSKLKDIQECYEALCVRQHNLGFPKPEMTAEMNEEKYKSEALIDVATEECEWLEDKIKNFKAKEVETNDSEVLKNLSHSKIRDGRLVSLAGQNVETINGLLIINDPRSVYSGMSVLDFRCLFNKYAKANSKLDNERRKLERGLADMGMKDFIKQKWNEKRNALFAEHPEWTELFSLNFRGKSLPAWPEGVKNHLKNETENGNSNKTKKKLERRVS